MILMISDENFLLLKNGDQKMFGELFYQNQKDIYNFLLIKAKGNSALAEDLLSETFMSAYNSLTSLRNRKNLKSWLLRIAYYKFVDNRRKYFRDKKYMMIRQERDELPEAFEEIIHKKQKALLFKMALEKINPKYQDVFRLKYKEGKSIKEIADLLRKTEEYVINSINRAKAALKKEMMKIAGDFF